MPNRYLRAAYVDSKTINQLTAEAERMFCRLLVHVDDFGRCEADADLLRGKLFSRQLDRVKDSHIKQWVEELARYNVLFLYELSGKMFLQMNKWEQGRAKHSRCPHPPTDVNMRLQMFARENISPDSDPDSDTDTDYDTEEGFVRFWEAYPNKTAKKAALKAWKKASDKPAVGLILDAVERAKNSQAWKKDGGQFIPHPATWLNGGRWNDVQVQSGGDNRINKI